MRSRLEADYAAYLDMQGRYWAYEPECFAGVDGQWLPDFGSSFTDADSFWVYTEVKPAGPLKEFIPGSIGYVEHVDSILSRMAIAWESKPNVALSLAFRQYEEPTYLEIFSPSQGSPWLVGSDLFPIYALWNGMGQCDRLRSDFSAESR